VDEEMKLLVKDMNLNELHQNMADMVMEVATSGLLDFKIDG
jgi:hypothetical protein